jgi:ribosomal protein L11 methyltransferase
LRTFPALELIWTHPPTEDETGIALAWLDAGAPIAVSDVPLGLRVFFPTIADRDEAHAALAAADSSIQLTPLLVPDENWAERSQAALTPISVGRIVVSPPWWASESQVADDASGNGPPVLVIIQPSMGFGTGHHATTRLCLALLQRRPVRGARVLDVGTGSGVLAIAAWRLGAARALGIDVDPDALQAAAENVERNHASAAVSLELRDIETDGAPLARQFQIVFANLTGALLCRVAPALIAACAGDGAVITSGFQPHERELVVAAFTGSGGSLVDEAAEDDWVAATFSSGPAPERP